jgi:hypothetical protein
MKIYRDLKIYGNSEQLEKLIEEIEKHARPAWNRNRTDEIHPDLRNSNWKMFCFQREPSKNSIASRLWFIQKKDHIYVSNLFPIENKPGFKPDEYNRILQEFYDSYIDPIKDSIGILVNLSDCDPQLEKWISSIAAQKLRSFSLAANRSGLHPLDQERFYSFIIEAHLEASRLDSETLKRWLLEDEEWPEDMADNISIQYEFGRSILREYDKNKGRRQPEDSSVIS